MEYSHTGKAVLDFYKTLPFNYYGTIEQQCDSVSQLKSLEHLYPCLEGLVSPSKNLLEIGCGAGWLTNSIANNYKKRVLGLDFNPHAIERAQAVSNRMELKSEFLCDNLFHFSKNKKQQGEYFDLIISLGVLHHTDNCIEAIKAICKNLLATEGYFFVGLYHQYGRKPFLKYFENLKKSGHTEDELLKKYKELHPIKDETLLRSWFRDQVLHPHETLHTIEEIIDLLSELSCQLVATSINKFSNINNLQDLIEEEKTMGYLAKEKLIEKKYFPGFFVFLLKKK
jgi:2-polyprenyl-3-methyl-5-hydroxy-6-metoxy-1,4-benzoquinol methylase